MGPDLGRALVVIGLLILLMGMLAWAGALSWFGHLPGDIRIERDNVRLYLPWVSMLLISIVVTVLLSLFRR